MNYVLSGTHLKLRALLDAGEVRMCSHLFVLWYWNGSDSYCSLVCTTPASFLTWYEADSYLILEQTIPPPTQVSTPYVSEKVPQLSPLPENINCPILCYPSTPYFSNSPYSISYLQSDPVKYSDVLAKLRWRHSYGKKFFHKICDSYFCTHEL